MVQGKTVTKKDETCVPTTDSSYGGRKAEYEFGGPVGATALIVWSHLNLIYFW
jgi:hypothetical protein